MTNIGSLLAQLAAVFYTLFDTLIFTVAVPLIQKFIPGTPNTAISTSLYPIIMILIMVLGVRIIIGRMN